MLEELKEAADTAAELDHKMERLHKEIEALKLSTPDEADEEVLQLFGQQNLQIPPQLLQLLGKQEN